MEETRVEHTPLGAREYMVEHGVECFILGNPMSEYCIWRNPLNGLKRGGFLFQPPILGIVPSTLHPL